MVQYVLSDLFRTTRKTLQELPLGWADELQIVENVPPPNFNSQPPPHVGSGGPPPAYSFDSPIEDPPRTPPSSRRVPHTSEERLEAKADRRVAVERSGAKVLQNATPGTPSPGPSSNYKRAMLPAPNQSSGGIRVGPNSSGRPSVDTHKGESLPRSVGPHSSHLDGDGSPTKKHRGMRSPDALKCSAADSPWLIEASVTLMSFRPYPYTHVWIPV